MVEIAVFRRVNVYGGGCAVEKKKLEPLGAEGEDRRKKSQRVVGRLEKDLADATKELQALAVSSKLVVTAMVMLVMFMVNKR